MKDGDFTRVRQWGETGGGAAGGGQRDDKAEGNSPCFSSSGASVSVHYS